MFKRLKIKENDIKIFQLARRAKVNFLLQTSFRCDHNHDNFSDHNQGNVKSKQFFSAFLDGHVFFAHLIKKKYRCIS